MNPTSLKMYPLPTGDYVVSYFDQLKGKRNQTKFDDELEARSFYQGLKTQKAESILKNKKTAGSLLRSYLEENPNCQLGQSKKLVQEFLSAFETFDPKDLSEKAMNGFLIQLRHENDYSDRTMLLTKSRLQGFFGFLIENELFKRSPIDDIKFKRGAPPRRKPVIIEQSEIGKFILLAKKYSPALFYPIFLLIHETAAKTSDILELQWKDLNLKTRKIFLIRSKELQDRDFMISQELAASLGKIPRLNDFVFTNLEGQQQRKHILARELKRFQRQLRIETNWGLKDLRTSYAANFLRTGGDIKSLQKILGHSRPYQTEEIYGRYKVNYVSKAAVQGSEGVSKSEIEF